jgi:hypothetical protein
MQEKQMIGEMEYDFNIWYKTFDPVFLDINKKSRVSEKWLSFNNVKKGKYSNSILKPINTYVESLVPPPKLISITGNTVRLRQGNHAEFFLLQTDRFFKHIDRPWLRQYYNTKEKFVSQDNCFIGFFKFYVPWYIDEDIKVKYLQPECETPFYVYEVETIHKKIQDFTITLEPDFVPFSFRKEGKHMIDDVYGKIKRQSAMFDIVFECDDIMLKRVKEFYEKE